MRFSLVASSSTNQKESGYSLVIVLMISVIMLTLLTAVSTLVLSEAKSTDRQAQKKQAYYLAEEGVERFIAALYQAARSSNYPTSQSILDSWVTSLGLPWSEASPAGTIEIQAILTNNGIVELTSIGRLDHSAVQQQIDTTLQLSTLPKIFTYALGFGKEFEAAGDPDVILNGSFYINGEAKLKHGLTIQNGVIDLGPDADVKEADLKGYPVNHLAMPVDMPSYQQLYDLIKDHAVAAKNETVRLSELLNQPKKIVFFDHDADLIIDTNSDISKSLLIVAKEDIKIKAPQGDKKNNNQPFSFSMFLYAPNGSIDLQMNDFHLTGGIIAGEKIKLKSGQGKTKMEITCDNQLFSSQGIGDIPGFVNSELTILSRRTR